MSANTYIDPRIVALCASIVHGAMSLSYEGNHRAADRVVSVEQEREWLLSEECQMYCEVVGLDWRLIEEWVHSGCRNPHHKREMQE